MKLPTEEQFGIAVLWLQSNEGDGVELEACKAVASWLDHAAGEIYLHKAARAAGVPIARLRRRLAEQRGG